MSVVPSNFGDSVTSGLVIGVALPSVPASDTSVTGVAEFPFGKFGGVPLAVAVFCTPPAMMSACVIVYVPLKVVASDAPIPKLMGPPVRLAPNNGSLMLTAVNGTFPVLLTVKL